MVKGKKTESRLEPPAETSEEKSVFQILKQVFSKLEECCNLIEEQKNKIEELKFEVSQLKCKDNVNVVKTYSEVTKNKSEHVLVVKPKKDQTNEKVKEDLKNTIKPDDLQVGINIGKSIKDGGVIVKCTDVHDLNTIKNNIQHNMGKNYEVKIPKKFRPRIIIVGVEDIREEDDQLIKKIIKQNKLRADDNFLFKLILKTKTKNGKFNLIIETDPVTFKLVLSEEGGVKASLHVGWKDCFVYEHFNVFRCFKCCGFNHEAEKCTEVVTCPLCSGNHKIENCNSESKKCSNCIRANKKFNLSLDINHSSIDRNCSCHLKIIESIRRKTEYEV